MLFATRLRVFLLALLSLALAPLVVTPQAQARPIEDYTPYQGQVSCHPTAKPGTLALSQLLMKKFGGGSLGISRSCNVGGLSEHKEGRAFDWALNANNKADRARAKKALRWLTAEVNGVEAYRAKRMGIMYMIWNREMWRGYDVERGWSPYTGASPHTDHVHISLTWSGARKLTSWWTANPVFDYGPCQKWENKSAKYTSQVRLEPCPTPLIRPKANKRGFYRAQEGESVARLSRWFDKPAHRIRKWNSWPSEGWVRIEVGERVRVARP